MKKIISILFLFPVLHCAAQTEKISSDSVLSKLDMSGIGNSFLNTAADKACKCIEKIKIKKKSAEEVSADVSKCIEKEVSAYEMGAQMMGVLTSGKKENTVYINPNPKEHNKYYFEIEEKLRDTCPALNFIIAGENKESESSMSNNKTALKYYRKGQTAMTGEDYQQAVDYFQKAVEEDDNFSFAWDNLGISLRKLDRLDEAIAAYKKSLIIDPKNRTALQNLAVAYGLQKKYDKALDCYKKLVANDPDNPEGFYGLGQTYLNGKEDYENALSSMCKAYNLYAKIGSPYRTDAQQIISYIYGKMKEQDKLEKFNAILKENNLNPDSK